MPRRNGSRTARQVARRIADVSATVRPLQYIHRRDPMPVPSAVRAVRYTSLAVHHALTAVALAASKADLIQMEARDKVDHRARQRNPLFTRNTELQARHVGQRCFIIGTGPSLAKQDLSPLRNEVTIATNSFWRHDEVDRWQPTYFTLADGLHFSNDSDETGESADGVTPESVTHFFESVRRRIRTSTFIVPYQTAYAQVRDQHLLPLDRTYFVPFLPASVADYVPDQMDLVAGLPWVQNVSQWAIMLALSMGCNPIILIGCDHDWLANAGSDHHYTDRHFYKGKDSESHPDFPDWKAAPLTTHYWYSWLVWAGHERLRTAADARGVQILNATGGGILDVYPRVRYQELFAD